MKIKKYALRKNLSDDELSLINLTPLIDTILVLLIIVILLIPQIETRFQIILPKQQYSEHTTKSDYNKYFCIMIDQHGVFFLKNKKNASLSEIKNALQLHMEKYHDTEVIIYADKDTLFENVISIIDFVNAAGIEKLYIKTKK